MSSLEDEHLLSREEGTLSARDEDCIKQAESNNKTDQEEELPLNVKIKASMMLAISAFWAASMSLIVNVLAKYGIDWAVVTFSCGLSGSVICWCGILKTATFEEISKNYTNMGISGVISRTLLGGMCVTSAFFALNYMDLADANVLMFTLPLWAGMFGAFFGGKRWDFTTTTISLVGLCGVILIVRPGFIPIIGESSNNRNTWYGEVSALAFGISNGLASVLIGMFDRQYNPFVITATYFMHGSLVYGLICMFITNDFSENISTKSYGSLAAIGLLMFVSMELRNRGLGMAGKDTSLANILYLEIAFAYFWDIVYLKNEFNGYSFAGCMLIVGSAAIVAMRLNSNMESNAKDGRVVG